MDVFVVVCRSGTEVKFDFVDLGLFMRTIRPGTISLLCSLGSNNDYDLGCLFYIKPMSL